MSDSKYIIKACINHDYSCFSKLTVLDHESGEYLDFHRCRKCGALFFEPEWEEVKP